MLTLFQAALEVGGPDVTTSHGALHVLFKQPPVVLQDLGSLLVQWVLGVGLQEEILQAINYGVYRKDWLPVLSEDVEADVALEVNIGMINHCLTLHLGRVVWVTLSHLKTEYKLATLIEALIRTDNQLEVEEVVWV